VATPAMQQIIITHCRLLYINEGIVSSRLIYVKIEVVGEGSNSLIIKPIIALLLLTDKI